MIDPVDCVFWLVTISSCLFLMETMPKCDIRGRYVLYVVKVFEAFEGHKIGRVILISSANSEMSPPSQFTDEKYLIAIVV